MFQVHSGYDGVSTMDVTAHSDFSKASKLLSQPEDTSIIGRNDINLLLSRNVMNREISSEHAHNFVRNARHRFTKEELRK